MRLSGIYEFLKDFSGWWENELGDVIVGELKVYVMLNFEIKIKFIFW